MFKHDFPLLTQELYDQGPITGTFVVKEKICFNRNPLGDEEGFSIGPRFEVEEDQYMVVYLKDGVLHNDSHEKRPSLIRFSFEGGYDLFYFVNGLLDHPEKPCAYTYDLPPVFESGNFIPHPEAIIERADYYMANCVHRLSGPAVILRGGKQYYFIYGQVIKKDQFDSHPHVIAYKKDVLKDQMNRTFNDNK